MKTFYFVFFMYLHPIYGAESGVNKVVDKDSASVESFLGEYISKPQGKLIEITDAPGGGKFKIFDSHNRIICEFDVSDNANRQEMFEKASCYCDLTTVAKIEDNRLQKKPFWAITR